MIRGANCAPWSLAVADVPRKSALYRSSFKSYELRRNYQGRCRCTSLGSWPTRKDLNLRPSESESDALSSCATGRYEFAAQCRFERPTRKTRALHAIRCAKSATCAKGCKQPSNLRRNTSTKLLLPPDKQKDPRHHKGAGIFLAYPKGFEPSTFRVGV